MIMKIDEQPIEIYDLRHSHATILINEGAKYYAESKRLGHSDINMTHKIYTHLLKENEDKLLSILENGSKLKTNTKKPLL